MYAVPNTICTYADADCRYLWFGIVGIQGFRVCKVRDGLGLNRYWIFTVRGSIGILYFMLIKVRDRMRI